MTEVSSFVTKTHLEELLDRAAKGEKVFITRRGKPVAKFVTSEPVATHNAVHVVYDVLVLRDRGGPRLGADQSIRDLIGDACGH